MTVADDVDATLRRWVEQRDLSGSVLVTRGGDALLEGSYGLANRADGVPVTPRTRFGLASFTKMFTAVATVSTMQDHGLPYGTPVVDLLPASDRPTTLRGDVTVHHLLTHTSGIADYFEEEDDEERDYADLWTSRSTSSMRRPADFLPMFADLPPYRGPGERFQYSNAGYVLLGLVLEQLVGRPYTAVVQDLVLDRAGMADSGFLPLDEVHPDVATGYLAPLTAGGPWRSNVFSVPVVGGPDGGAFATARDVDRFLRCYADGGFRGPETREVMLTPYADVGDGIGYGYGVYRFSDGRWGHDGGDPGVEVQAYRYPELDAHLIVLCNTEVGTTAVRRLVFDALLG